MYHLFMRMLESGRIPDPQPLAAALTGLTALLAAGCLVFFLLRIFLPLAGRSSKLTPLKWATVLASHSLLRVISVLSGGILLQVLTRLWFGPETPGWTLFMQTLAHLWIVGASTAVAFALLDALESFYLRFPFSRQIPIRAFVQIAKLLLFLIAMILAISSILNRSPALLVSGLGAMTAVLMLVFKDPILGFVAGIQLSANRMLAVGDWLEMPKYHADGDVIEITLTTVKVCNWDRTITTIPTYALITEAFKNWRGMTDSGGRRIKRSIFLDMTSVHFLRTEELNHLRNLKLIASYINEKQAEIERENLERQVDPACPANGRHLTNLGTLRAYLVNYLRKHPGIRQDMILIVRQLQPTPQGLPLEVYAFTADTSWVGHEGVQSDIFDHILAVIPEFGLRIFQSPSGADLLSLKPPSA